MRIRPEADARLRAALQRRVDARRAQFAGPLAHAEQVAEQFRAGSVVGVYTGEAGGGVRRRAYVLGLLPLLAAPVLIVAASDGVPGALFLLGALPFLTGAWFGVCLWRGREPRRELWLYAFTGGFLLIDRSWCDPAPVPWSQVGQVQPIWSDVFYVSAEDTRPVHTGYDLQLLDGRTRRISRALHNVRDPYRQVGELLSGLLPAPAAAALPRFPDIDELIATYLRTGPPPA
jgi:hypothetical protein